MIPAESLLDQFGTALNPAAVPDPPVLAGIAAVAVTGVLHRPSWRVLRHVVTMSHEGGHAAMARLTGRRLRGVRLHSDTSGVTVSSGRPTGPGVVLTLLGGYLAPAVLGLLAALAVAQGWAGLVLWGAIGLLAVLLLMIRNLFGVLSVVVTGAVLIGISGWAPPVWRVGAGYLLTWFLLLAAPRPVLELQRSRARGRARGSDADQLARLTGLPAGFWVLFFLLGTVAALVVGVWVMLRVAPLPTLGR